MSVVENMDVAATPLLQYADRLCEERLRAYAAAPHDAREHANVEQSVLAGGYAYRQIAELVQNAADAIVESGEPQGRIVVVIDSFGLWAANTGQPVDEAGVLALLNANTSGKRSGQIGRFGLGFKSLLKLGGDIAVLSRTVCLLFDPPACRSRIRKKLGLSDLAPAPGLRLAEAVTWQEGLGRVAGAERFDWASTVVFAQLKAADAEVRVAQEMSDFPSEFLLFLPVDVELVLMAGSVERHLKRRTDSDGIVVIEDLSDTTKAPQRWRVFERHVAITSAAAIEDATDVHARDEVPLIWAAPVGRTREQAGRFFAFFPTSTETRTLGILNAPWKLNSDRTALIRGAWNAALMEAAADFIIDNLEVLAADLEPGGVLDAFPRELQNLDDPAAPLVNALWGRLQATARLPDCDGIFQDASALYRPPHDQTDLGLQWSRLADPDTCTLFIHPTCTATVGRVARLGELTRRFATDATRADEPRLRRTTAQYWLTAAASGEPAQACDVLKLADAYAQAAPGHEWDRIRDELRIIPDETGALVTAPEATLTEDDQGLLRLVHPDVLADATASRVLQDRFLLREAAETEWLRLVEAKGRDAEQSGDWSGVWELLRRMPWAALEEVIGWTPIEVRSLGGWASPESCIRSGILMNASDVADASETARPFLQRWIIDDDFHREDTAILDLMKVGTEPLPGWDTVWTFPPDADPISTAQMSIWLEKWKLKYHAALDHRPNAFQLGPQNISMPVGWELMCLTGPAALPRVTEHFLKRCSSAPAGKLRPAVFRHATQNRWQAHEYPHPLWHLLSSRGELQAGSSRVAVGQLLGPKGPEHASRLGSFTDVAGGLAALQAAAGDHGANQLDSRFWPMWLRLASSERVEASTLQDAYEAAAKAGFAPDQIPTPFGPLDVDQVLIGRHERDIAQALEVGRCCLCLSREAGSRWVRNGAAWFADVARTHWTPGQAGEESMRLVDVEPALRDVLNATVRETAAVLFVATLDTSVGAETRPLVWSWESDRLLVHEERFDALGWRERVALLIEGAETLGWIDREDALGDVTTRGVSARRREVADAADLPHRLLKALGGPRIILELFEPDIWSELSGDDVRAATVAITLYGPALFSEPSVRAGLLSQGLEPPERWGTEAAAAFIAEIGFPADFAASPGRRREPELFVSGPVEPKALHDYQLRVVADLDELLASTLAMKRRRAVISLPTGAGKTRVAAQTAVTRILGPESDNRLVVWIAQTDELCEQAVQCFRELWATDGVLGESLRVVRLWGGQSNPQAAESHEPTVVVATIQTLTSRMNGEGVEWLNRPGLMVIDECHHALTPTYTNLFRWLRPDAENEPEPPVVGLSATPFRGRSEDETAALARRFDGRLIPADQSGLFESLQDKGVLARFRYTRLEMETRFELTPDEQRHFETFKTLPESAMERLGANRERNDRIIDAMAQASERSALVFATSVKHARRLAARLNVMGVSAAVVSGETDKNSRRWFVRAFQEGSIQVLCNHSALTTGFDAPATDLIVIARPVFSPALYMQMVGRGLRGPLNGGKPACRILTVQDNLDRYSDQLAHHYFEQYYVSQ